jgi:hypothetical protein
LFDVRAGRGLKLSLIATPIVFAGLLPALHAQAVSSPEMDELAAITAAAAINDAGPEGMIPATRGFNASVGSSSQHDSTNGWSSILTPNVAYRLNRHFSIDAAVPIYTYINIDSNLGTEVRPDYRYAVQGGIFGDTSVSFQGNLYARWFGYNGTVSLGLPSGNTDYGLGAGQVTYSINNRFEKYFRRFTPDLEIGIGDTSVLVEQRVLKSYVSVGPMAHFQAGTSVDLRWNMTFEADAYEELPLDKNLVYSTTGRGKKKVTTSTNIDPGEDNGFITSLDIPLSLHVTLSGFYNRSLRDHDDVGGFSFTFLLKAPPRPLEMGQ